MRVEGGLSAAASRRAALPKKGRRARRGRVDRLGVVERVEELAATQAGVVSRAQAAELGADKDRVRQEVRSRRWAAHGRHTVVVHRGGWSEEATWRAALLEVGKGAALDGATALRAAQLEGFESAVHVSIRHGLTPGRPEGVVVHELIGWHEEHVIAAGIRRVSPDVAAVRAATWAVSDRQAALVLLMTVQQRLALPARMLAHAQGQLRLRRRELIEGVLAEAADGVQALGELDFARLCRQRGLPEPTRQVVRRRPGGRAYLDVYWEKFGVVVEIDGLHHLEPEMTIEDALRQNDLTMSSDSVLRIPSLGLRINPRPFLDQVEKLLTVRGAKTRASRTR